MRWRFATTGRDLREMRHGALIRDALERRVVGEVGEDAVKLAGHTLAPAPASLPVVDQRLR